MEIQIETLSESVNKIAKLSDAIGPALEKGLDRGTDITTKSMKRLIRRTYNRKVPKTTRNGPKNPKGTPKWTRTGALAKSVAVTKHVGSRDINSVGPAAKPITNYDGGYAEKLRTLPRSKDGVDRANDYPTDTADKVTKQVRAAMEYEIKNFLRL